MKSECKYLPQVDYITGKASVWVFLHIFHRLPKVAGGPTAVQRGDKLFYITRDTQVSCMHARRHTHADLSHLCRNNVGHRVMDAVSDWP